MIDRFTEIGFILDADYSMDDCDLYTYIPDKTSNIIYYLWYTEENEEYQLDLYEGSTYLQNIFEIKCENEDNIKLLNSKINSIFKKELREIKLSKLGL